MTSPKLDMVGSEEETELDVLCGMPAGERNSVTRFLDPEKREFLETGAFWGVSNSYVVKLKLFLEK